jgi:transposase
MTVEPHLSLEQLHQAAKTQPKGRVARRMTMVAMAQQSLSSARIAELVGSSERTVRRWVERYNEGGLEALEDLPRSGRPTKLTSEQEQAFINYVEAGPDDHESVSVHYGKDYQRMLEEHFGQVYSLSGVYQLLHRLGYSWLMPRPQHEQVDPAAQDRFKKTLSNK